MREILAQLEEAQKQLQLPLANASGESPYDAVFRAIVAPIADVMPKYLKEAKVRVHSESCCHSWGTACGASKFLHAQAQACLLLNQ